MLRPERHFVALADRALAHTNYLAAQQYVDPRPHRLTDRVLAMPGMAERYRKLLKELAATAFDKGRLLK